MITSGIAFYFPLSAHYVRFDISVKKQAAKGRKIIFFIKSVGRLCWSLSKAFAWNIMSKLRMRNIIRSIRAVRVYFRHLKFRNHLQCPLHDFLWWAEHQWSISLLCTRSVFVLGHEFSISARNDWNMSSTKHNDAMQSDTTNLAVSEIKTFLI